MCPLSGRIRPAIVLSRVVFSRPVLSHESIAFVYGQREAEAVEGFLFAVGFSDLLQGDRHTSG